MPQGLSVEADVSVIRQWTHMMSPSMDGVQEEHHYSPKCKKKIMKRHLMKNGRTTCPEGLNLSSTIKADIHNVKNNNKKIKDWNLINDWFMGASSRWFLIWTFLYISISQKLLFFKLISFIFLGLWLKQMKLYWNNRICNLVLELLTRGVLSFVIYCT